MRRVVISHSQLPKRPQVSLFHTQTNQKLNGKLGMLGSELDLSLPCCSHSAFVTMELRVSSPRGLSCSTLVWLSPSQAEMAPGSGSHGWALVPMAAETPAHCESPEYLFRLGLVAVW